MCRIRYRFTGSGVCAAGIRPQAARVILRRSPTLQEQATARIEDQDGDGSMQQAARVRINLFARAELPIAFIHQYNVFRLPFLHSLIEVGARGSTLSALMDSLTSLFEPRRCVRIQSARSRAAVVNFQQRPALD